MVRVPHMPNELTTCSGVQTHKHIHTQDYNPDPYTIRFSISQFDTERVNT